jgi:SAM-dependent methyltransferase
VLLAPSRCSRQSFLLVLTREAPARAVYSCVVDPDPRLQLDVLRWFAALTESAGVSPRELVVHAVGDSTSEVLGYLCKRGVDVRVVEPFDERSPHCNKISAACALASSGVASDLVVLTDADVAIRKDPIVVAIGESTVGAKTVDKSNPPLDVLRNVFGLAGIGVPQLVAPDFNPSDRTIAGNLNGGLYLVPGALFARLSAAWAEWARWLLDCGVLGPHAFFTDQVAMALALAAEGIGVSYLERAWNFPTHHPEWVAENTVIPAIVHYHTRVKPTGLLAETGNLAVDEAIARVNASIATVWHDAFPNRTFWEWRYKTNPSLGSGVGSRSEPLKAKRRLLRRVVARVRPESVLDVGCGDGEATRGLRLRRYIGLDVSEEAVRLARTTRPDGEFHVTTIRDSPETAELTICLDVLIHQADPQEYRQTVKALLEATSRVLLVSGYERRPSSNSPMIHFHEPLSITVERTEPTVRSYKLREEHEITTLAVVRPPFEENWPPSMGSFSAVETLPSCLED